MSADPVPLEPAGSPLADALVAVAAAAAAAAGRWPGLLAVSPWEIAVGGHERDAAGPGDGGRGGSTRVPSREAGSLAVTLDAPASAGIADEEDRQ